MDNRHVLSRLSRLLLVVLLSIGVFFTAFHQLPSTFIYGIDLVTRSKYKLLDASVIVHAPQAAAPSPMNLEAQKQKKAFLGNRPHAHTLINVTNIVAACQGHDSNGWRDTRNCLRHLRYDEQSYQRVDLSKDYACEPNNPVKYHTYWRGPLTWRVSFMLKSWLFTQNLHCSRIFLWLDGDYDLESVENAMRSIELAPFLPLVELGLIVLQKWIYPPGVYIPREYQDDDFGEGDILYFRSYQIPRGAVAVSDSARFIILHLEGGLYFDMDTMFLRDLRPLLITPGLSFAERWGAHAGAGEYNTAYLQVVPNSSLSSRILQGAAKMGVNFHPRILGRMLAKTGHTMDLVMFETALFDPLWSEFDQDRTGACCTPCLTNFGQFFEPGPINLEWSTFHQNDTAPVEPLNASNRTLSHFYRGAYTYHIHNQWTETILPGSWVWVADETYKKFFRGSRSNPYGEQWPFLGLEIKDR